MDVCGGLHPPKPADGQAVIDWFAERLKRSEPIPQYLCDGKTVYRNRSPGRSGEEGIQWQKAGRYLAPQDLMSVGWVSYTVGGLSLAPYVKLWGLVYPDLTPEGSTPFELDLRPSDAPGCVLTKRSCELTDRSVWHEWCYIDPAIGHAVVRAEAFLLPADSEADSERQSFRMEDFQQSPKGFWYPTVIRHTMHLPSAERDDDDEMSVRKTIPRTTTVYYHMDSDAVLPDSLFTIDEAL